MSRLKTFLGRVRSLASPFASRDDLPALLAKANPKDTLEDRVDWLERLLRWIQSSAIHKHGFDAESGQLHVVRLRFLFHLLERNPEWKTAVAGTLRSLVAELQWVPLLCEAGLTREKGFLLELVDRVLTRFLPAAPRPQDAEELFSRAFRSASDAIWIENLPSELIGKLIELARPDDSGVTPEKRLQRAAVEALAILGADLAAMGCSSEMRRRLPGILPSQSPFLRLNRKLSQVMSVHAQKGLLPFNEAAELGSVVTEIAECREAIRAVLSGLEHTGVSVGLVYLLERQLALLKRVELLAGIVSTPTDDSVPERVAACLGVLIRDRVEAHTLRGLIHANTHLLSRKIVEHTSDTGEHYITRTRAEYFAMLRSAAGGGFVMVGTTLIKNAVMKAHAALFVEGFLASANYAGSFILMQFMGFSLATKQTSMTASTLASKLKHIEDSASWRGFVEEVACLVRSQFAAAVGNIGGAMPVAALLDLSVFYLTGNHVVPVAYARKTLHSLHPLLSFSVLYAALTGVLLWASSIVAGWFGNWVIFNRLPEAIASHRRLKTVFGQRASQKLADWFSHHAEGIAGNSAIGFFLGFAPVLGTFFGLPLDIRHVTLSSAAFTLSVCSLYGTGIEWVDVAFPLLGIALILVMNFSVSFGLALFVAMRAQEVQTRTFWRLVGRLGGVFRKRPRDFFLPPATAGGTTPQ